MRKRGANKTAKRVDYECCDATMHAIYDWQKHMFEELGWMILAKRRGMLDKVNTYKNSLARLKMTILKKHKHVRDLDKKDELMILLKNVEILTEHANEDL
jgi:hypothetical protein